MTKKSKRKDNSLIIVSLASLMIMFLIFLTNNRLNMGGFTYDYETFQNTAGQAGFLGETCYSDSTCDKYLTHGRLVELLKEADVIVKTNNDNHLSMIPQWNCIDACGEKGKNCFYSHLFVEKYHESAHFRYPITCSERLDLNPPGYILYCGCI